MLAALGGACGVLLAIWGTQSLAFLLSYGGQNLVLEPELNWKVLSVAAGLSLLWAGVWAGSGGASDAADVMPALKNGRGGGPRNRAQHVLVVAQIAISFLILVAAGLLCGHWINCIRCTWVMAARTFFCLS